MKQHLSFLLICCCFAFAKAQLQSNNWYFGINAGINFSNNTVTALNDGQLVTGEGCATISDNQGNLLFYTDGSVIYDRNHNLMPNGTGLKGNSSSTSSAIIVPQPGSSTRFYVFTVDTDDILYRNNEGFFYSVVDLSLNNGDGDVIITEKNINLLALTSEKLTAISNSSGTGFWIITQFEDKFFSYELTSSGLTTTPVVSIVSPFIELVNTNLTNIDVAAMRGYIKVNPRGDKLVAAHFSNNTLSDFSNTTTLLEARSIAYTNGGELYLYDFDNSTGIVSNPQPLMTKADGGSFYGVEFSSNGQFLYAEVDFMNPSTTQTFEFVNGQILQFDLTSNNIANSRTVVYEDNLVTFRGALQLGPDNKIYHSRINQNALSVINAPNFSGISADYRFNDFQLSQNSFAIYGLPIFVQSFLISGEIVAEDHCFGENHLFTVQTSAQIDSITWDFGDPASGTNNSSINLSPTHTFSQVGTFTVRATIQTPTQTIDLEKEIQVYPNVVINSIPDQITKCDEGFDTASFDLSEIADLISTRSDQIVSFHTSREDATNGSNIINSNMIYRNVSNPESIFIRVENDNCFNISQLNLQVENCPIEVFNVVTPNNDGLNDTFIVSGLKNVYENHKISIFTRYGQKVWEGDNNSASWDGTSNVGLTSTTGLLPTGTYFYVIELNEPNTKPQAGYVYLR
ncbi:gliding motility-associated C-terminal domain-containing protein [Nonlabens tegetincola]|uniref:T9SS type B sorting domain-containing protein n=1 Tax=Nonlabens tegetincola TaxID=323273 RepID=UPI0030C82D5A